MARARTLPIDRLIALLRTMDREELLMAEGAIRALAPRNGDKAIEEMGEDLALREEK